MAAEKIGEARCPLGCGSKSARVSLSKSGLAVLTCNGCNMQLFTRSGRSDEAVRALILTAPPVANDPAPAAVPALVPAPAPVAKPGFGLFKF